MVLFCTSTQAFSKSLNIGFDDIYPFSYIDEQGEAAGFIIDDWRNWAKLNSKQVTFIPVTQHNALTEINEQSLDIFATYNRHKALQNTTDFSTTQQHYLASCYIYVHQDLLNVKSVADLLPYTIGSVENTTHNAFLSQQVPDIVIRTYKNSKQLFEAANKGEIVAFASGERLTRIKADNASKDIQANYPDYRRLTYEQDEIVALANTTQEKLLASFDEYIRNKTQVTPIISKDEPLIVVFNDHHAPYSFSTVTGRPEGLFIDVMRLWAAETGKAIGFMREGDLQAYQAHKHSINTRNDKVIFIESHINSYLQKPLSLVHLLYRQNIALYISLDKPNIQDIAQLKSNRIGITEHLAHISKFNGVDNKENLIVYSSYKDLFMAVKNKEIDAFFGADETVDYLLTQSKMSALFYTLSTDIKSDIYLHTTKQNETLINNIKNTFPELPLDKLMSLENKWLANRTGYFHQLDKKVLLNIDEQNWLLTRPNIKVGMVSNWSPMEFIDENNQLAGINSDIFNLLESRIGISFSYHIFDDWEGLINAAKKQEIDMLASVVPSTYKKQYLTFSEPYWHLPWAIVHPITGGTLTLSELRNKKVAVISGGYLHKLLTDTYTDITLVTANDINHAYYLLQSGEVSAVAANLASASELLKRESLIQMGLSIINSLGDDAQYIAVNKSLPYLASIVDKSLNSITKNEKKAIYDKWFAVEVTQGIETKLVVKIAMQIVILTLVIISIIIFWNRRLYIEVKQRKKLEQKMKYMATHDELTGLANRTLLTERITTAIHFHKRQKAKLAVLFIDLDGFKNVNDKYGHDVGDELLKKLTERLKSCVRDSDTIARFGGDEFVLLLTGLNKKTEASFVAEKVINVINQPVKLSVAMVNVGCSIGISSFPDDGDTDTELLKVADTMMYHVKDNGKNDYQFS